MVQTIIIARTDKIGDFVVSIPSYATARAMFPEAKIVALVSKYNRIIAEHVSCIDECVCIDDYQSMGKLGSVLRAYNPDVFVALVSNNTISRLACRSGAARRIGPRSKLLSFFHYNDGIRQRRSLCNKSEAAYNLDLIRHIDPKRFDECGVRFERIQYGPEDVAAVASYLQQHHLHAQGFILVNPFTGGSGANLALDQYALVIDEIIGGKNPYLGEQRYLTSPRGADIEALDGGIVNGRRNSVRREFYEDQQAVEAVAPEDLSTTKLAVTDPEISVSSTAAADAVAAKAAGDAAASKSSQLVREWAQQQETEREQELSEQYSTQESTNSDGSVTVSWSRRSADSYALQHQRSREVAAALASRNAHSDYKSPVPEIVILGMKQHEEKMQAILKGVSAENQKHVHFFINEGSLLVAAALVDRCKVFIGPSTGITQIAGNYLKPAICFYSSRISNSHRRWELYGDPEEVAFTFNIKNLDPNNKELSRLQDGMKQSIVSTVLEEFYRS